MKITVESNSIADVEARAIVVNLFEGVRNPGGATGAVDRALDGAITALIADGEIKGKLAETTVIHTLGNMPAARVVVAGLGKSQDFDIDRVRRVSGTVCTRLRRIGVKEAATIVHGAGIGGLNPRSAAEALAEGALLGLYRFDKYKSGGDDKNDLETLRVVEFDDAKVPDIEAGVETGAMLAEAVNRCRDMVNEPANEMTPSQMAEAALEVALASGLEIEVLDRSDMEELGMGALLGVAQGSDVPPKLIVIRYKGNPDADSSSLGLLGKGITFDSGGLDLKPAAGMRQMKRDMSGGAAVIAARGASSAASAANACINHVQSWYAGAAEDDWVSMGIPSTGAYGSPAGVIFSYPLAIEDGAYRIVEGLELSDFDRAAIAASGQELLQERAAVADWLS